MQTARALSRAFVELGNEVRIVTSSMDTHATDLAVPLNTPIDVDGISVIYSRVPRQKWLRRWGFSFSLIKSIWHELTKADFVILHFHYQFATWLGAVLCRIRRKPYVIFTHGSLNFRAIRASGSKKKQLYLSILERQNYRHAAFIAYQSQEELEASLQFNSRAYVVPNGIEPNDFLSNASSDDLPKLFPFLRDKFVFLFLGRVDPNKGLDVLLPAFANLLKSCPGVHLLLAGPDERGYQAQVEETARQLQIEDAVTFAGFLGGEKKLAALRGAHAFVLPSRYEGLSMAMLEAMYCGLPVITTPYVGLWKRVDAERCGLITELTVESLTHSMASLVQDPEAARQMGLRGCALVEREHQWKGIAARFMDTVACILSDTSHREAV